MVKYFSLVSMWTLSLSVGLLSASASLTRPDPSDDFSFSLGYSPETEVYRLISERHVSEILADRLDIFPKSMAPRLAQHILSLCKQFRFDPAFILSLIHVESRFRVKAISPVGAVGLMQLMVPTANYVIHQLGLQYSGFENFKDCHLRKRPLTTQILMDPFVNISVGIAYLASLRDYYEGFSPYHVLAAYNVGPARMDELLAQKSFRPTETKKYFQAIRRGVPQFRFYERSKSQHSMRRAKNSKRSRNSV